MILLFKIIHIDKLTVYSSPDIIESSTHVLGLMTKVKRPIFENYFALNLSRFYKKIVFVSSNFYWNHQFSRKKRKSKHVHWSKAHVVSNFFVKHTRTKIIVSLSSRTHQVIWKMRAPKGTQSAHPQAYTASLLQVDNTKQFMRTNTGTPCRVATTNHEGYASFHEFRTEASWARLK